MLVQRRSFLIGAATSLLAAPALVKASSLDAVLRGYIMDPKVLARMEPRGPQTSIFDSYQFPLGWRGNAGFGAEYGLLRAEWNKQSPEYKASFLNQGAPKDCYWKVIRRSELIERAPLTLWE